jgi:hypothetical protein
MERMCSPKCGFELEIQNTRSHEISLNLVVVNYFRGREQSQSEAVLGPTPPIKGRGFLIVGSQFTTTSNEDMTN